MTVRNYALFTEEKSKNSRIAWGFYLLDGVLFLDYYRVEVRPSARHNWRAIRAYYRVPMERQPDKERLIEADVPLTDEIKRRAIEEFTRKLTVKKWSERRCSANHWVDWDKIADLDEIAAVIRSATATNDKAMSESINPSPVKRSKR